MKRDERGIQNNEKGYSQGGFINTLEFFYVSLLLLLPLERYKDD